MISLLVKHSKSAPSVLHFRQGDGLRGTRDASRKGKAVVINGGICGNRVLRDAMEVERFAGNGKEMGRAGIRRECNQWIREQRLADGGVDFDRAVADRVNPCRMAEGLHLGDGVHPNTEGGILMAEEVVHKCFVERGNV
ncbi:hypothetical protein [Faecalicatena contorta]|uniref:hypothetical protein n=1 Tax=Faecalicatena contorta TaxID=39482 RepID=UPI001899509F|nr:hypothetical protein [Faecalicatena contorta]